MKPPPRDWRKLGECQKVIKHSPVGGWYQAVAVNSEGLLAVTDRLSCCVHLLTTEDAFVRSIGKGMLGNALFGVAFDLKGNIWVTDYDNNKLVKLSQNGQLLQTIHHTHSGSDHFCRPFGVSVSQEGLIYVCDYGNHRITVHDEEGKFLFAFGTEGSDLGCFSSPIDIVFDSGGLVYVTDDIGDRVSVWSKEGAFQRDFKTKCSPTCIAATGDNHLLVTSLESNTVMVYTLEGELIHHFGTEGSQQGRFGSCWGICIDNSGLVYVADGGNKHVQVF